MQQAIKVINNESQVIYFPDFISFEEQNLVFNKIKDEIEWEQTTIKIFGKSIRQPRLSCWVGDEGCTYKYSSTTFEPKPWTKSLLILKQKIESTFGLEFNSALLNYYRDGDDSMGSHSDNEKELGVAPIIASLSFGENRKMLFKNKNTKEKVSLELEPGSLLIMKAKTQSLWKHEIPKTKKYKKPRLNITFRNIYPMV